MRALDHNKAYCHDNISVRMIKFCAGAHLLTLIIQNSLAASAIAIE